MMNFDFGKFGSGTTGKVHKSANISEKVVDSNSLRRVLRNDQRSFQIADSLDNLCPRPKEGEQYRIITEKSFNAYAFICSLLEEGIEDLHLAIYRINEPTVISLMAMLDDGRIRRASFIISSFFNQTKKPEKWADMLAGYCQQHPDRTSFAYLHNHAKIACVRTSKDECFVFEGSGNMSDNARIEKYTYEQSREVYQFHCEWMDRLIANVNGK